MVLVPAAVLKSEADQNAKFSISSLGTSWKLPVHRAYLILAYSPAASRPALERLQRFTWLVAAVAQATGAVGIYLGGAQATHDPRFFIEMARTPGLPALLMLWSGIDSAADGPDRISLLSLGLRHLGLPELRLTAPRGHGNEALEVMFDFLAYVAERGKRLPEGDTIGRTADERLKVHYEQSPLDPAAQVWRVDLP